MANLKEDVSAAEEQLKNETVGIIKKEVVPGETDANRENHEDASNDGQTQAQENSAKKRKRVKKGPNANTNAPNNDSSQNAANDNDDAKNDPPADNEVEDNAAEPGKANGQNAEAQKQGDKKDLPEENNQQKKANKKRNRKKKKQGNAKPDSNDAKVSSRPVSTNENNDLDKMSGLIFMCNAQTKEECFRHMIFGLPAKKKEVVARVYKGMRLFLFDVDLRLMYGIYKAARPGGYDIKPKAFGSAFPSQVSFKVLDHCSPLPEEIFKQAIKSNYVSKRRFNCELKAEQVKDLCRLFKRSSDRAGDGFRGPIKGSLGGRFGPPPIDEVGGSRVPVGYDSDLFSRPRLPLPRAASPVRYGPYRSALDHYEVDLQLQREREVRAAHREPVAVDRMHVDPYLEYPEDRIRASHLDVDPRGLGRGSELSLRELRLMELEREKQLLLQGGHPADSLRDREIAGLGRDLHGSYGGIYREELVPQREALFSSSLPVGYHPPIRR